MSGYPVNSRDSQGFWEIVESNPDDQVYVVNKVGATNDSEEMSVDFKKVRQRVRVFSRLTIRSIILKVRGSQTEAPGLPPLRPIP